MGDLDKRALDRWITREPESTEEQEQIEADMENADKAYEEFVNDIRNNKEWQIPIYEYMKAGDQIRYKNNVGVLTSDAQYKITPSSGLFYANVQWKGATLVRNYMLCLVGLEWLPKQT